MDKGASPDGDRATAVEPVPVSPLRDGIPSAEKLARAMLKHADKVRAKPLSEFGGGRFSSAIREGVARGFEGEAYRLCPFLQPAEAPSLWHRVKAAFLP